MYDRGRRLTHHNPSVIISLTVTAAMVLLLCFGLVSTSAAQEQDGVWSEPNRALQGTTRSAGASLMEAKNGTLHMVFQARDNYSDSLLFKTAYYYTNRSVSGGSWDEPVRITDWEIFGSLFDGGGFGNGDFAVDDGGRVHFVYTRSDFNLFGEETPPGELNYVTNASGSWSSPVKISGDDNVSTVDPNLGLPITPSIAVGGSLVDVVYIADLGDIYRVREVTKNGSWTTPETVSDDSSPHDNCNSASIAVHNGNRYLVYTDYSLGAFYSEYLGGWGPYACISDLPPTENAWAQGRLVVNDAGQFVLYVGDMGDSTPTVRHTQDTGEGWTSPVSASDGIGYNAQFDADSSGNLYMVYNMDSMGMGLLSVAYREYDGSWGAVSLVEDAFDNKNPDVCYAGCSHVTYTSWLTPIGPGFAGFILYPPADVIYANNSSGDWGGLQVPSNPSGLSQYDVTGAGAGSAAILTNTHQNEAWETTFTEGIGEDWQSSVVTGDNPGILVSCMATDSNNNHHALYGTMPSPDYPAASGYYVNDISGTWSTPVEIDDTPDAMIIPYDIEVGPDDSVHFVYAFMSDSSSFKYRNLTDGAWSTPQDISGTDFGGEQFAGNLRLGVDGGGKAHVVYHLMGDGGVMYVRYNTNSTGAWGDPSTIANTFMTAMDLNITGGPSTGEAHLVYGGGSMITSGSMYYMKHTLGGWTEGVVISGSDRLPAFGRTIPQISLDSSGNVHVAYMAVVPRPQGCDFIPRYVRSSWTEPVTPAELDKVGYLAMYVDGTTPHLVISNDGSVYYTYLQSVPQIDSIDPGSGSVGSEVTISGSDFGHSRGSSYVSFGDTRATEYTSWSNTEIQARVPSASGAVDVTVTTPAGTSNSVEFNILPPPTASAWYMAEGYTGGEFDTYVLVSNPNGSGTTIRADYMLPGGDVISEDYFVPKYSRFTIHLDDVEGLGDTEVSTKISSLQDLGIVCERSMYFEYRGKKGGHCSIGTPETSSIWYLPEGYTGEDNYPGEMFDTYVLVMNPNSEPVTVEATFMKPDTEPVVEYYDVPARGRFTIPVDDVEGCENTSVSTEVECMDGHGIVSERAMYFDYHGKDGGHSSIGATGASDTWYLPEGYTGYGNYPGEEFDTYILVQNPNDVEAKTSLVFMKDDGEEIEASLDLPPQSRRTIHLNEEEGLSNTSVATQVTSTNGQQVVCERAMYFDYHGIKGGHDTIVPSQASRSWYMAEGYTGNDNYPGEVFDTYVLVQNPTGDDTEIRVTFMLPNEQVLERFFVVPAHSRYTMHLDELNGLENTSVSTAVQSDVEIICERSMYFDYYGRPGGHCSKAY